MRDDNGTPGVNNLHTLLSIALIPTENVGKKRLVAREW